MVEWSDTDIDAPHGEGRALPPAEISPEAHIQASDGIASDYLEEKPRRRFHTTGEIMANDPKPRRDFITDRIEQGKVTVLSSEGGVGKSTVMLEMVYASSHGHGQCLFGEFAQSGARHCLLISGEDSVEDIRRRIHTLGLPSLPNGLGAITTIPDDGAMPLIRVDGDEARTTEAFDELEGWLSDHASEGLGCVVIDPVSTFLHVDQNKREHVQGAISKFANLATKYNVAVILVHHFNKGVGDAKQRVSGSAGWSDGARAVYTLEALTGAELAAIESRLGKQPAYLKLCCVKDNGGLSRAPIYLMRTDCGRLVNISDMFCDGTGDKRRAVFDSIKIENNAGRKITKTGADGIHEIKHSGWPGGAGGFPRDALRSLVSDLVGLGCVTTSKQDGLLAIGPRPG